MKYTAQNKISVDLLSKWYKNFGVDNLFTDLHCIEITDNNQEKHTIKIENSSPDAKCYQNAPPINFESTAELRQFILNSNFCFLKETAKNTVFSDGNEESKIMIIGEAPGAEEDEQGKPFVGQSGKLLDGMLRSIDISRNDVYISNILFWRPPGNRTPSSDEIASCLPYVHEHIRLIAPKVLLLLGGVAVKSILNTNESISKLRGKINKYNIKNTNQNIDVISTFHPAYLLRSPTQKSHSFSDLLKLKKLIGEFDKSSRIS